MAQASLQSVPVEESAPLTTGAAQTPAVSSVTLDVSASMAQRRTRKERRACPDHCLNCGRKSMTTRFCPDCGQENTPHAVSLGQLLGDILEEFMKWDGRLFRTLALLLFFPGRLTKEYNAGRRVNYVSPFKMYFVVSALFVLLLSFHRPSDQQILDKAKEAATQIRTEAANEAEAAQKEKATKRGGGKSATGKKTAEATPPNDGLGIGDDGAIRIRFSDDIPFPVNFKLNGKTPGPGQMSLAYETWQKDKSNKRPDPLWLQTIVRNMCHAADSPGTYIGNLIQGVGKTMFFLLPFYAFLLAVFFFRARRYYVEHLILAVNNHTMAFLIGSAADLTMARLPVVSGLLILSYWLYELIALRVVYGRSWVGTLFRQGLIWFGYAFALLIGFVLTALITLILPS